MEMFYNEQTTISVGTAGDCGFRGTDLRLLHGDVLEVTSNRSGWGLGANELLEVDLFM